jgi:serine/threonine protein kinase
MDLKVENIVIKDFETLELALIDFAHLHPCSVYTSDTNLGTLNYCPPELNYAYYYNEPYLPERADMFCVGIIMFMIMFSRFPFDLKKEYDY